MISLFLTALLGLFCCSSININALDNTKEIEVREEIESKSLVHNETELILTQADFLGTDFIYCFITGLVNNGYTTMALSEFYNYSLTFNNMNSYIFNAYTGNMNNKIYITKLVLNKAYNGTATDSNGDTFYKFLYSMDFYNNETKYYTFNYWLNSYNTILARPLTFVASNTSNSPAIGIDSIGYYEQDSNTYTTPLYYHFLPVYEEYEYTESYVYSQGYSDGRQDGYSNGWQIGYNKGLQDGADYDDISLTIFTGILEVGLLPVNVFLQLLNFEVFGINIGGLVTSLLTIAIVVIIIRVVTGKKND